VPYEVRDAPPGRIREQIRLSRFFLLDAQGRGHHIGRAMPELPEVEVVRLRLLEAVVNRRIAEVHTERAN
jgi:hypothetical protein